MSKIINVAVVDDHNVVRLGIKSVLKLAGEVAFAGELGTGEGIVAFLENCRADVVLLDVRMPGVDGLEALKAIRAARLNVRVLMLTTSDVEDDVASAVKFGADGYVLKDLDPDRLIEAIRTVASGGRYFPRDIQQLYEQHLSAPELSDREKEILLYIAKGLSNKDVAAALNISSETVKRHLKNIFGKLQVNDRVEAVTEAISRGIIRI